MALGKLTLLVDTPVSFCKFVILCELLRISFCSSATGVSREEIESVFHKNTDEGKNRFPRQRLCETFSKQRCETYCAS